MQAFTQANELVAQLQPWSLSSSAEDIERAIFYAVETLRISGLLLRPFMPQKMDEMLSALGSSEGSSALPTDEEWEDTLRLRDSFALRYSEKKVKPLFPKLQVEEEAKQVL